MRSEEKIYFLFFFWRFFWRMLCCSCALKKVLQGTLRICAAYAQRFLTYADVQVCAEEP
jgi:hypothetical protein